MTQSTIALFAIVALAFTIEGALGFGATVVAVALGALVVPLDTLLPLFVPLNMALSASLLIRGRKDVDTRLLFRRVLPLLGLGLPFGIGAARFVDVGLLTRVYGVLVVGLGLLSLFARTRRAAAASDGPPAAAPNPVALLAAGVVHGAFGTGGPLVIYAVGDALPKAALRPTLAALWLLLNTILVATFVADGRVHPLSIAPLALAVVVGLVLGEILHRTLPLAAFRTAVWLGLVAAGVFLAFR